MPRKTDAASGDSPPSAAWPFPRALPGVQLRSCQFAVQARSAACFAAAGISAPAQILAAAGKRQSEYLAGRRCAVAALAALGQAGDAPGCAADRSPSWPRGYCGSITHSHGWAAAVAARQSDWLSLGLDGEALLEAQRAHRLAAELLTPEELQRLARLPEAQQAWLISLTFSSKESLFKALYPLVQQRFYFQDAELLHWDADGQLQLRLLRALGPDWPAGSLLSGQHARLDTHVLSLIGIPAATR